MTGVVAFTGRAGAGKSTAADVLEAAGWTRIKFASTLKAMFRAMLDDAGVADPDHYIEGAGKEDPIAWLNDCSPRYIMQTLGTEWGRSYIDTDLWVKITMMKIIRSLDADIPVVIDDCRFENEADALREMGATICQIDGREGIDGDTSSHASEHLPRPDCKVYNTGTIDDLTKAINYIFLEDDDDV